MKKLIVFGLLLLMVASVSAQPVFHYLCCDYDYCLCPGGVIPQVEEEEETQVEVESSSGGSSFSRTLRYLYQTFIPHLNTLFVPREEYNTLEDRVFMLEARISLLDEGWMFMTEAHNELVLLRASQLKQEMYNTTIINLNEYRCVDDICMKVTG